MKLILLAVALFFTSAAVVYVVGMRYKAFDAHHLQAGAVFCTSPDSIAEAKRAVAARDPGWLAAISECGFASSQLNARAMDCSLRFCRARLWTPTWDAEGYVEQSQLAF